jgi:hypothetical protein
MHEVDGLRHKLRHMKLHTDLLACRYVQYYADLRKEGPVVPKRLQLRRVTVTGLPPGDTKDLIVGVWSRPPGAGWKSHLMCLAAARPQSMLSNGQCICDCTSVSINDCRCRKAILYCNAACTVRCCSGFSSAAAFWCNPYAWHALNGQTQQCYLPLAE